MKYAKDLSLTAMMQRAQRKRDRFLKNIKCYAMLRIFFSNSHT